MIWAGNSLIYKRDKGKFQYADIQLKDSVEIQRVLVCQDKGIFNIVANDFANKITVIIQFDIINNIE